MNPTPSRTKVPTINRTVLMSGADHFDVLPLNPYSHHGEPVNRSAAHDDFELIKATLTQAGVAVQTVPAPHGCQDGIFTANWALCRNQTAVMSSLPTQRAAEHQFAEAVLSQRGFRIIKPSYRFSGQGDALPCGNLLFAGAGYRTDKRVHSLLATELGYNVISLETVPERDQQGQPVINKLTGWPDSPFYDIDLAISVLSPDLIAWYPEAFTPQSQDTIAATAIKKIEVTKADALNFACNLVSTGHTVVMGDQAPTLKSKIEAHGLSVTTVAVKELGKGGGFIRCTTLTLDNI